MSSKSAPCATSWRKRRSVQRVLDAHARTHARTRPVTCVHATSSQHKASDAGDKRPRICSRD